MRRSIFFLGLFTFVIFCHCSIDPEPHHDMTEWKSYLGGPDRSHYTQLSHITKANVNDLEVVWSYSTKDSGQMQMHPIMANGLVYGVSPSLEVFALDAATGVEKWTYSPSGDRHLNTSRGITYWYDKDEAMIFTTSGPYMYAIDPVSGQSITSFGDHGKIDLRSGLPAYARDWFLCSNTPGTIYKNLVFMPVRLSEGAFAAPGYIQAIDVYSGDVVWTFRTIPSAEEKNADTWRIPADAPKGIVGGANNWAGMAIDTDRDILFAPIGSAAPDFYGGIRQGDNLYANSLVALRASTGEYLWHYQFTHHDIWDRDPPAPPNLLTITHDNQKIDVVAQVTKQGYVFVFDRVTGKPIYEIEEIPVPGSSLVGEMTAKTQPRPVKPLPFARQAHDITSQNFNPYTSDSTTLIHQISQYDRRWYAPPDTSGIFLLPGYDGGAEWGGAGADPENGILYVNSNEMPWLLKMNENKKSSKSSITGEDLYSQYCANCHQSNRQGIPASGFPSLIDLHKTMDNPEVIDIISTGRGMMTGFPQLSDIEKDAIANYLLYPTDKHEAISAAEDLYTLPYKHAGYKKLVTDDGMPIIDPPWGTLHAIDLNSGDYIWSRSLGITPALRELGKHETGCENYGGPIVTSNGLLFIAGTKDGFFRAFDRENGDLLWEDKLPAASFATPNTYAINGQQLIVLACGGEKLGTPKGNKIIAYGLKN